VITISYTLLNTIAAFGQPINDPMSPTMSVFKAGSTIPVKFQLTDQNGNLVADADASAIAAACQATLSVTAGSAATGPVDETVDTAAPNSGFCFRYDPTAHQFIYNLGTKGMTTGGYTLTATVTGSFAAAHNVQVGVR
jgi:hypothetical protein